MFRIYSARNAVLVRLFNRKEYYYGRQGKNEIRYRNVSQRLEPYFTLVFRQHFANVRRRFDEVVTI